MCNILILSYHTHFPEAEESQMVCLANKGVVFVKEPGHSVIAQVFTFC